MLPDENPKPTPPGIINDAGWWQVEMPHLFRPSVIVITIISGFSGFAIATWASSIAAENYRSEASSARQHASTLKDQLDAKVKEANEAIKQMRSLGLALAAPILTEMSTQKITIGEFLGDTLEEQIASANRITAMLENLQATPEQIAIVRKKVDQGFMRDFARRCWDSVNASNTEKLTNFESAHLDIAKWGKKEFQDFIAQQGLKTSDEIDRNLNQLDFFIKNRRYPPH